MRTHFDAADVGRMIAQLAAGITAAHPPAAGRWSWSASAPGARCWPTGSRRCWPPPATPAIGRGVLDITLYRDDLSEIGPRPMVRPTRLDVDLAGRTLVLVDDVLFTGRTVRAALDAIADFGRPRAVRLAVLVDRGGRELPIQPDHVALVERHVPPTHRVKVKLAERDGADEIVIEPRQ